VRQLPVSGTWHRRAAWTHLRWQAVIADDFHNNGRLDIVKSSFDSCAPMNTSAIMAMELSLSRRQEWDWQINWAA
jgi:hypothetical protein